ncbi:MAG TPA: GNAT family N-acetyltransferase [Geminicoccaceae bacterium]|nr:GNAT family N-acetyltransferase [Geminicoccaceae bacterium]
MMTGGHVQPPGRWSAEVVGAPPTVRRLGRHDLPAIEEHLLALGPMDRHGRFHACLGDAAIAGYVRRIDFGRMILVGAVGGPGGRIVGLAEAHLDGPLAPAAAEVSVSVLPSERRRGIGRRLVARAVDLAFERGAGRAEFVFNPDNRALARLVGALGGRVQAARGHACIDRPRPFAAARRAA